MEPVIGAFTLTLVKKMRERQAEYLEECHNWHKQGYRPEVCIHGTYMWTDYDNMCMGCELGEFSEYTSGLDLYRYAWDLMSVWLIRAGRIMERRTRLALELAEIGVDLHHSQYVVNGMHPLPPSPWGVVGEDVALAVAEHLAMVRLREELTV